MKLKKFKYYDEGPELLCFDDDDCIEFVVQELESHWKAKRVRVTKDPLGDQIFIDFLIEEKPVTVDWHYAAGTSIDCEDPELRERLFQHFLSV